MNILIAIVLVPLLNLGFVFLRRRHRRTRTPKKGSPEEVYLGLRSLALQGSREQSNLAPPPSRNEPWGVLMDWGVTNGTASVLALSDGHASVYLSSGGGYLGGAESHDSVRTAAKQMIAAAIQIQPRTHITKEFPLPRKGEVVFYLLTDDGVFTANAMQRDLSTHSDPLSNLGDAAQNVITQYRLIQPGK